MKYQKVVSMQSDAICPSYEKPKDFSTSLFYNSRVKTQIVNIIKRFLDYNIRVSLNTIDFMVLKDIPTLFTSLDFNYNAFSKIKNDKKYEYVLNFLNDFEKSKCQKTYIEKNINYFAKILNLSELEKDIFYISVLKRKESVINNMFYPDKHLNSIEAYSKIFNKDYDVISNALLKLVDLSLMHEDEYSCSLTKSQSIFFKEYSNLNKMFERFYNVDNTPKLKIDNFNYLSKDIEIIKSVVSQKKKGTNILLYGIPGVGKTELAKAIITELGLNVASIAVDYSNIEQSNAETRLCNYKMSQCFLKSSKDNIVLFDEIEDILPNFWEISKGDFKVKKGSFNRTLENNETPTIWISNIIHQLDPAYIRRFTYCLEMKTPPKNIRKSIITEYTKDLKVSENWIDKMAEYKQITPADINNASNVAKMCKSDNEDTIAQTLKNNLNAMDKSLPLNIQSDFSQYKTEYLNTNYSLDSLIEKIEKTQSGTCCLYGPPGTGKTEYAKYLSNVLQKPLIIKRASDLLSMWVGETEKNIMRSFEEAIEEEAVLLLDEADSFLADRRKAMRNWEVTQVNELLTRMEEFGGIFIASTNLIDSFDQAAFRRFDFKIKFMYMTESQRLNMFSDVMKYMKVSFKKENAKMELRDLVNLTPGDFAVLKKQFKFDKPKYAEVIDCLRNECSLKKISETGSGKIGF